MEWVEGGTARVDDVDGGFGMEVASTTTEGTALGIGRWAAIGGGLRQWNP